MCIVPYSTYVHKWLKKRILLKLEITKTAINANYWIGRKESEKETK